MARQVAKIARAPIAGRASGPRTSLVNPLVGQPSVTLGDVGRSFSTGFQDLAQAAHEDDVKRDNVRAVQVEGAFQREIDTEIAQLNPLDADYMDRVQDILNGAKDTATSSADFLTADVAQLTDLRLSAQVEKFRTLAQVDRRTAIEKVAIDERRQGMDAALAAIRNDPDAVGVYITKFTQDLQRLNTSISPEKQQEFADQFSDAAIIAQVEGLALAGRFKEARALADLDEEELNPKEFRALKKRIRSIEARDEADTKVDNAAEIAEVEIAILNERDPEKARLMVEDAHARGIYNQTPGKRVVAERMVVAKEEEERKIQEERATILLKLPTGLDSQKEADTLWEMVVEREAPRLKLLSPVAREAALLEMAVNLVPQTGFIPTAFKRIIENAEHVEDPQVLARAAQYSDAFRNVAPGADTGIGDRGKNVSAARERLGLPYKEAAMYVLQRFPNEKVLAHRIGEFSKIVKDVDFSAAEEAAKIFDLDADQVPTRASIKYQETLSLYYNQTGNMVVAQAAAARTMAERFGVTTVGSPDSPYLMEFPPERFIPGLASQTLTREQQGTILTADAQRGMDALGIPRGIVVEGIDNTATLQFVVTPRTLRQIAAGERPEYDIYTLNSYGWPEKTAASYVVPTTELLLAIPEYREIAESAKVAAADARSRKQTRSAPLSGSEGPDASSGTQTPGQAQGSGPAPFTKPTQGLPPGAQGVATGVGGA